MKKAIRAASAGLASILLASCGGSSEVSVDIGGQATAYWCSSLSMGIVMSTPEVAASQLMQGYNPDSGFAPDAGNPAADIAEAIVHLENVNCGEGDVTDFARDIADALRPMNPEAAGGAFGVVATSEGVISNSVDLSVDEIAVGDCLNTPDDDVFYEIMAIDCTELHDLEVFAVIDLSTISTEFAFGASYPGDDRVYEAATDACLDEFETYVGKAYEDSVLFMDVFTPTFEGWREVDDRIANCVVFEVDARQTEIVKSAESLRNAGR